jgi:hypothetical protein
MKNVLIFTTLLLSGCASSSGILKAGADTYRVNTSASMGAGGLTAAKNNAYAEAKQECAKQGKSPIVIEENSPATNWADGKYTFDLTFKCN